MSFSSSGGKFESALLHVRDEKTTSTHGGTSVAGSFQTRILNTSLTNEISGASLSSNQITLPSGTYYIIARQAFWGANYYIRGKLRNVTDSSDVLLGDSIYSDGGTVLTSFNNLNGRFTIASQKTFELQYRVDTGVATIGLGHHTTYATEIYTDVQIWKVS